MDIATRVGQIADIMKARLAANSHKAKSLYIVRVENDAEVYGVKLSDLRFEAFDHNELLLVLRSYFLALGADILSDHFVDIGDGDDWVSEYQTSHVVELFKDWEFCIDGASLFPEKAKQPLVVCLQNSDKGFAIRR